MLGRLTSLGISAVFAGLSKNETDRCIVLYYHGVKSHEVARFARQMVWLKSKFSVVPLRALLSGTWSGRCACITFDDGLDNVRQNALPILRELNLPATIFAVPGNLGGTPSWAMANDHPDRHEVLSTAEQLKEYPANLIEIGSHTMTHPDLTGVNSNRLHDELVDSKRELEQILNRQIFSFSVPFGAYNDQTIQAARAAEYQIVATCDPDVVLPRSSSFCVGRFKVKPGDWDLEFHLKANGHHQWRRAWQTFRRSAAQPSSNAVSKPRQEAKAGLLD